ncbi:MAG: CHASE2 domain-containing protein, partial [Candidatus Omnitrophota bacterium]
MKKIKIKIPKNLLKILIAAVIPALIILASYFRIFETYELATLDLRFRFRPPQKITDKVVLVDIAEDTLDQLGEWPIDRGYYSYLIDALTAHNAGAIVFDIVFGQSSPAYDDEYSPDELLIESARNSNKVYLATILGLSDKSPKNIFPDASGYENQPLPSLKKVCRGIGHINVRVDIDGKRRRVPLFLDLNGELIPQISFLALCDYLNISIQDIDVERGRFIKLTPGLKVPIDSEGHTMVNFAGRWGKAFKHYSFIDILKSYAAVEKGRTPIIDLDEFNNKICIVGLTAVATHDLDPIPLQKRYPMVGFHANLINTILTKSFIIRVHHLINLIILALLSLAVVLSVLRLKPSRGVLAALGIFFGFVALAFGLFGFFNIWIDLFYPLILISGVYIFCTFYRFITERNKRLLMEKELDIAQRIQRSFLKETSPKRNGLDIGVIITPAKSVGGDLYDFVEFDNESLLGIMIGDVSGKGMPAALFMAKTVSDFRFHAKAQDDSLKAVTELNDHVSIESTSGLFVTLCYIVADANAGKLSIVDAGHLPVVHAGKDKETILITATGGMAIGIMDGVEFHKNEITVCQDDVFVLYTDGVTEARNTKIEEFGEIRLKDAVTRHK